MKKTLRIISLILIVAMLMSITAFAKAGIDQADPCSSRYILSKTAAISAIGGGTLKISFSVTAYSSIDELGACQVNLYTADGRLMKTYYSSAYASMMGYNCSTHSATLSYPGTVGTRYYVTVVFYAENNGIAETKTITTGTKLCV